MRLINNWWLGFIILLLVILVLFYIGYRILISDIKQIKISKAEKVACQIYKAEGKSIEPLIETGMNISDIVGDKFVVRLSELKKEKVKRISIVLE